MGNNIQNCQNPLSSQQTFESFSELQKNPRGRILRDSNDNLHLLKQYTIFEEPDYLIILGRLNIIIKQKSENILKLKKIEKKVLNSFCSSAFKIYALFEYSAITLSDQIYIRKQKQKHFQERDIYNIALSLVNGYKQIVKLKNNVFNNKTKNNNYNWQPIIISMSAQEVYIMDDGTLKIPSLELQHQVYDTVPLLYTPQRFQNQIRLNTRYSFPQQSSQANFIDPEKQAMFVMGTSLLRAACLIDEIKCFDYKNGLFRIQIIQKQLRKCQMIYGKKLTHLIALLLQYDPSKRINFDQLQYILQIPDESKPNTITQKQQLQSPRSIVISCSKLQNMSKFGYEDDQQINNKLNNHFINNQAISQSDKQSKQKLPQFGNKNTDKKKNMKGKEIKGSFRFSTQKKQTLFSQDEQFISLSSQIKSPTFQRSPLKDIADYQNISQYNQSKKKQSLYSISDSLEFVTLVYPDGTRYQGTISQKTKYKQGKGKLFFSSGTAYYQGNFIKNQMDGFGVLYYSKNVPTYQGYWNKGNYHGQGILYNHQSHQLHKGFQYQNFGLLNNQWIYYRGKFFQGKKSGRGCLFLTNGQYYEGNFENDKVHGIGQFHLLNNHVIKGQWRLNKMIN